MKILLLTDIPPCRGYPAGLVLDRLCRFMPEGSISCFAVIGGLPDAHPTDDLGWIPYEGVMGPRVTAPQFTPRIASKAASVVFDLWSTGTQYGPLQKQIEAFSKAQAPDLVWATLEGPTLNRIALPMAERLGVPLLTQVFDPPHWWMRDHKFDGWTTRKVLNAFDDAMRATQCCAAASWAMAEEYSRDYGSKAIPVVPSMDAQIARPPATKPTDSDTFIITLAGQIYATAEWTSLLAALDHLDWTLGGKPVRIRVLGRSFRCDTARSVRIEFLGWNSQPDTIQILSESDILYCPYWFDPVYEREARLSFPSKLTSYLASGRPVFLHCPEYASPAGFARQHDAAHHCGTLQPDLVAADLRRLAEDTEYYAALAAAGSQAFHENLTLEPYRRSFAEFLGVEESFLRPMEPVDRGASTTSGVHHGVGKAAQATESTNPSEPPSSGGESDLQSATPAGTGR